MDAIERSNNLLARLATRINGEHEAVLDLIKEGLEHAIVAGKLLIEAKAHVRHGDWLPWLRANCPFPERTADHYMLIARHSADGLKEKSTNLADLAVRNVFAIPVSPRPKLIEGFLIAISEIDPRIVVLPNGMLFPDLTQEDWLAVANLLQEYFPRTR